MALHAIQYRKCQMRWSFSPTKGTIFLLYSSKIGTGCQQNKQSLDKLEIPCGTKFWGVLIFAIFTIFPAIRKNRFPQKRNTANLFPSKMYSRANILWLKFVTQKCSGKKSCLFNQNLTSFSFRKKTVCKELLVLHKVTISRSTVWNMYRISSNKSRGGDFYFF